MSGAVRRQLSHKRWAVPLALLVVTMPAALPARAALPPDGMSAASLNQEFRSYADTAGRWTGAASTVSVALPDGRLVWLFSDTFLGTVNADGSRPRTSPFINNSMIVQEGTSLVSTRHGGTLDAPASLVPAPAGEMYWVNDAVVEGGTLRALYAHMRKTGQGPLDFRLVGTALVTFALPSLTVAGVTELPLGGTVMWGATLLEDGLKFRGHEYRANRADLEDLVVAQAIRRVEIRRAAGSSYWKDGPDLLRHETVHSEQWNDHKHIQTFVGAYAFEAAKSKALTGSPACENWFEKDANLYWGGYKVWNRQPSDPFPECP